MRCSIFISRNLQSESVLNRLLPKDIFQINAFSLLRFSAINFKQIPHTDWIFFYSSKGVHFFFETLHQEKIVVPKDVKFGAIGNGTATTLRNFISQIDFIGPGKPDLTAQLFSAHCKKQRILFPRALHSKMSIQKLLTRDVTIFDLPVYKNEIKENFEIPFSDYFVLTSSMNAEAYLRKYNWEEGQQCIAIGEPTADTVLTISGKMPVIPEEPSEEAIAHLILKSYKEKANDL